MAKGQVQAQIEIKAHWKSGRVVGLKGSIGCSGIYVRGPGWWESWTRPNKIAWRRGRTRKPECLLIPRKGSGWILLRRPTE